MQTIIIRKKSNNYQNQKEILINKTLQNIYKIKEYHIQYTENGKPYLKNNPVYFSVSNDKNLLLIVFDTKAVGADIQFYKKVDNNLKKVLNVENDNPKELIDIFSKKEAVIKLLGKSLCDINNIKIEDYDIQTYKNKFYTINIAKEKIKK